MKQEVPKGVKVFSRIYGFLGLISIVGLFPSFSMAHTRMYKLQLDSASGDGLPAEKVFIIFLPCIIAASFAIFFTYSTFSLSRLNSKSYKVVRIPYAIALLSSFAYPITLILLPLLILHVTYFRKSEVVKLFK